MRPTLLMLLTMATLCPAQQPPPRPKIGVAFAGGSALGLSHVGVLKWFEENRIPVDYVAGTSMGALIGGMYATGRTADEVEQFIAGIDWNEALQVSVPFRHLSYRRKEDQREYPNTIEIGYKGRLRFPSGLSSGQGVSLVISRFAAAYGEMENFDDLPTPFRCVAVDLVKAREVVFDEGSLTDALRATMSLPGVFAPVRKGDMLLVDGGALNNLPVEVVRRMGADVVIAVALDLPQPTADELATIFGVARRSLSVMIIENERRNLGLADLVIMPDLGGVGATDYPRWPELVERGYKSAQQKELMLRQFALSEDDYRYYLDQRQSRRRPETVRPQVIEVEGNLAPRRRDALIDAIAADPNLPLNRPVLEEELTKITGMGRFDAANYTIFNREGVEGVRLSVHEKDHGPPFIKPAIVMDANRGDGIQFGIGLRATFLDLGGPASEWRTDLSIGIINRLATEYYHRIRGGKWFVAPRLEYAEKEQPLYRDSRRLADFTTQEIGGGADIGYAFGRFRELRMGYLLERRKTYISQGAEEFDRLKGLEQGLRTRFAYEGQDSAFVPRSGSRYVLSGAWMIDRPGAQQQFPVFDGEYSYAKSLPRRLLFIGSSAGGTTMNRAPLGLQFQLGGPLRLSALSRSQLIGSNYYYGGGSLLRSLTNESLSVFGRFYAITSYELGNAWTGSESYRPRHSGSLGLMGETAIGMVYFGGAIGDRGDRRLFFRLGRFF
jgi:NTE family protein